MSDTPRILITRAEDVAGERWDDYARCIRHAGGDPVAVDCADFTSIEALPPARGILVTAGIDVDPARYGQPPHERLGRTNPERDRVEGALIRHALDADLPLFAICRGFQMLDVAAGGSLLQHLEEREPHRARRGPDGVSIDSGWHEVAVRLRSTLMAAAGQDFLRVNSRHHQAVLPSMLGEGLVITAMAPDGVVEAIEALDRRWVLGVQWHPERPEMSDADDPVLQAASTALFDAFVDACRQRPDETAPA